MGIFDRNKDGQVNRDDAVAAVGELRTRQTSWLLAAIVGVVCFVLGAVLF